MDRMEVLSKWWSDPDVVICPAGETERIIEWLGQQTPETWHQVVMTWNYDYGVEVLLWIVSQDQCDRGTAARIFLVEGVGHWLWDALGDAGKASDEPHVCRAVLENWKRYSTAEFIHKFDVPDRILELIEEKGSESRFANSPLKEIIDYRGTRDAVSKYESEDGKIVVSLDHWMKSNGIAMS